MSGAVAKEIVHLPAAQYAAMCIQFTSTHTLRSNGRTSHPKGSMDILLMLSDANDRRSAVSEPGQGESIGSGCHKRSHISVATRFYTSYSRIELIITYHYNKYL